RPIAGSAGTMASMANALSAIKPASKAVISRAPGWRAPPGTWFSSNGMRGRCWRRRRRRARGIRMGTSGGQGRVRLIGLPTDSHSSFLRGAAAAPPLIRAALHSEHGNQATESGHELGRDLVVDDRGDLALDESDRDLSRIFDAAREATEAGVVPIFLGGDHMVTFPIVAGLAEAHGSVNILHFDAHPDLYEDFGGDPLSHASPFARIMERGFARRLV